MAVPIVMPKLGMVMSEGTIARWVAADGKMVEAGQVIAEIETEKINYDLEATERGILHHVAAPGDIVPVDDVVGYLLAKGEKVPQLSSSKPTLGIQLGPSKNQTLPSRKPKIGSVRSTPGARKLASRLGVDITVVTGTGPGGRVVENDIRVFSEGQSGKLSSLPANFPDSAISIPLEGMRKTIAEHMRQSLSDTAQLSFFLEVDVTEAQIMRREHSSTDTTISLTNVVTKACANTLKRHQEMNSILSNEKIIQFKDINIGIAVALKDGLIVPVLQQVDTKTILEISQETNSLTEKARSGKLLPDEVLGGTFTISVLGSVDGFTPILNSGQTSILGVGRSVEKPVVKQKKIVVREMATVSLTVDHQVIDGALAASFLRRFQQFIERPSSLFK